MVGRRFMALIPADSQQPALERVSSAVVASERIQSLDEYWGFYLSEHREPASRALHFVGTSAFFVAVGASVVSNPVVFPAAMVAVVGVAWWASSRVEPHRPAFEALFLMVVFATVASPVHILAAVVAAYACAWVGHFHVEGNRPATFRYPVWSLLSDFRMWCEMAQGRLWTGDPAELAHRRSVDSG